MLSLEKNRTYKNHDQKNKPVTAINAPKCRTRLSTQLTPRYPANE